MRKANRGRGQRVAEDMAAMRELNVAKLPEFVEEEFRVSDWSTVRVEHCAYSVPSRLIGEWVRVRIFEDRIVVRYAGKDELDCDRLRGRNLRRIDYRHIIGSLVRKPGGFARYVYREEMFPSVAFRRAYDAIQTPHHGLEGDLEYLRILHLAASTIEADIDVDRSARPGSPAGRPRHLRRSARGRRHVTTTPIDPPSTSPIASLAMLMRALKLPTFARHAEEIAQKAEREGWTFGQYLHHLAELEVHERRRRRIERDLKDSDLLPDKTLATLTRSRLTPKVAKMLPTLCEGGFVERGDNLLAFGLPGRGKTHLVCAIGYELIQRGYRVLLTATFALVQRLLAAKRDLRLEKELATRCLRRSDPR